MYKRINTIKTMQDPNNNDQVDNSFFTTLGYTRLMNEMKQLRNRENTEKYKNVIMIYDDPVKPVLKMKTQNNNNIEFMFKQDYPFKPPEVYIYYKNREQHENKQRQQENKEIYHKTLYCKIVNNRENIINFFITNQDQTIFIENEIQEEKTSQTKTSQMKTSQTKVQNKDISCLCCSTITCPANWSPAMTIQHILKEIEFNNKIKRNIKYKIAINRIIQQRNVSIDIIYPIYEFLK